MRPKWRKRKNGSETRRDGTLVKNPMRLGPYTMEARLYGLAQVLSLQAEINAVARRDNRPEVLLINGEERERIEALIAANTWPDGWSGEEPEGSVLLPEVLPGGAVQELLFYDD